MSDEKIDVLALLDYMLERNRAGDECDDRSPIYTEDLEAVRAEIAEIISAARDVLALNLEEDGATFDWHDAGRASKRLRLAVAGCRMRRIS